MNNEDYRYSITIWTNQRKLEWETNDISPSNIEQVVDLDSFDGDFVTKGQIFDKECKQYYDLSEDGNWLFVKRK